MGADLRTPRIHAASGVDRRRSSSAVLPFSRLCKPEVTGSIPVRSIVGQRPSPPRPSGLCRSLHWRHPGHRVVVGKLRHRRRARYPTPSKLGRSNPRCSRVSLVSSRACSPASGAIGRRYRLPTSAEHQEGKEGGRDEQDEQNVPARDEQQDNGEGDSDSEAAHGRCSFRRKGWMSFTTVRRRGQRASQESGKKGEQRGSTLGRCA